MTNGNTSQVVYTHASGTSHTVDYSYDSRDRLIFDTHANGTVQSYQYDSVNRLSKTETHDTNSTLLQSFTYTLDTTGRRTAITDNTGQATAYSYDNLYRLTDETITGAVPYSANYSYDAVGNRTFETIDGISTAYTVDDNDRLLTQGGVTYTYDAQGNTLSQTDNGVSTTYSYNANNKLASSTANGITTEYRYNHNGTRTAKIQGSTTTHYVFDENRDYSQVLVELNGTSTEVSYTYGDDLLYQTRAGVSSTYHYDGLGSTRGLSDATGNLTDSYQYDAFGIELASFGTSDNDYRYTGEQFDAELDQYHLRARQYAPSAGRFTQMDPWMGNNADPVTLHKYAYAGNSPSMLIDPSGKFFILGGLSEAQSIQAALAATAVTTYAIGQSLADSPGEDGYSDTQLGWLVIAGMAGVGSKIHTLISDKVSTRIDETIDLARAVGDSELGDLYQHNQFNLSPNGFEVKQFFHTQIEALSFGERWIKGKRKKGHFHTVEVTITESLYRILDHEAYEPGIGPIVTVQHGMLPAFNLEMNALGGFRYTGTH